MVKPIDVVRAAPARRDGVTPRIVAHDASGLVQFVCDVFDALGKYDPASPSVVAIGDSRVMISEAGARDPNRAFLYIYVNNTDSAYRRALEHGASSIEEPLDPPYGDRRCMVEDKWGNKWQIAVHKGDRGAA